MAIKYTVELQNAGRCHAVRAFVWCQIDNMDPWTTLEVVGGIQIVKQCIARTFAGGRLRATAVKGRWRIQMPWDN